jgi:hypothetical protein
MPQNVVDTDTWTVTVQTAADGDTVNGASRLLEAQDLSDRTRRLYNRSPYALGGQINCPFRAAIGSGAGAWTWQVSPTLAWYQTNSAGASLLEVDIPTLFRCEIDQVVVRVMGAAGHGALPTMPILSLWKQLDGVHSVLGTQVDTSINVAAYEVVHTIGITGIGETWDDDASYVIGFNGEAPPNNVNNLELYNVQIRIVAA